MVTQIFQCVSVLYLYVFFVINLFIFSYVHSTYARHSVPSDFKFNNVTYKVFPALVAISTPTLSITNTVFFRCLLKPHCNRSAVCRAISLTLPSEIVPHRTPLPR